MSSVPRLLVVGALAALVACGLTVVGGTPADGVDGGGSTPARLPDGAVDLDSAALADAAVDATKDGDAATCSGSEVACNGGCCAGICAANACRAPAFWVRADVGVTVGPPFVWADQSGKGIDVQQAAPSLSPSVVAGALAGRAVLRFANNARLQGPANTAVSQLGTADVMWFHVTRNLGSNAGNKNQVFGTLKNDGTTFSGITAGYGTSDRPYGMFRATTDNFIQAPNGAVNEFVVMDLRRAAGAVQLRRNGVVVATGSAPENVNGGVLMVGTERAEGAEFFNGDIAEIILFAGAFTDAERAAVAQALGARHAIVVQ